MVVVGDFKSPLSTNDRTKEKLFHDIELSINNQEDLSDIYRTLYLKHHNTFFPSISGTYTKIGHILGHKTNLKKFKRVRIVQSVFSSHSGIKLEVKNGKIT